ncbi:hypothetical protein [Persicobacter diffluens]|uniref:Lipoprotein n=1 Tax=Persicobacter diffluens TaxID=981 RepID=A0AAN4VX16_9BACT|nr:hypothetical protein PEDI_22460 [Persicobacter diffluens]
MKVIAIKILGIVLLSTFLFSCQSSEDSPVYSTDLNSASFQDEEMAEAIFNKLENTAEEALLAEDNLRITGNGAALDLALDEKNKVVTIDYGDGWTDRNGDIRKGKIIIQYEGNRKERYRSKTIRPENFSINDFQIEGIRSKSWDGINKKFTIKLTAGQISSPDGWSISRTAQWEVLEFQNEEEGFERHRSGQAEGINRLGHRYLISIEEPLVYKSLCTAISWRFPVAGIKQKTIFTSETASETRTIDYGDGSCDREATITQPDGSQTTFSQKKKIYQ